MDWSKRGNINTAALVTIVRCSTLPFPLPSSIVCMRCRLLRRGGERGRGRGKPPLIHIPDYAAGARPHNFKLTAKNSSITECDFDTRMLFKDVF